MRSLNSSDGVNNQNSAPSGLAQHLAAQLALLLEQSAVASLITDAQGVLQSINVASCQLLSIAPDVAAQSRGHYCLLRDKQFLNASEIQPKLAQVYQQGQAAAFEILYGQSKVRRKHFVSDRKLYLRASFTPYADDCGLQWVLVQLHDLTREHRAYVALQASEASNKAFMRNSSEAIWCYEMLPRVDTRLAIEQQVVQITRSAQLVEANPVLLRMLGVDSLDEVIGLGLSDSGSTSYMIDLEAFIRSDYQLSCHDIVRTDARGKHFYLQVSCTGVVEQGQLSRVWGSTSDVTARRRYEEKLRHQSLHDSLTGLPNRSKLYEDMSACLARHRDGQLSALLLIDLDRFKEINDTLGHNLGDKLLQQVGPRLAVEVSDVSGTIARLGGDEFAVFLPSVRHAHQVDIIAHRLLDALGQEFELEGVAAQVGASIGIALAPQQAQSHHELMRYADIAMYYAKRHMLGLSLYSPECDAHTPKRLAIMNALGRAIRDNQLHLYFQPKVVLAGGYCHGFEALLRWQHPQLGMVPPDEFIPLAELTSFIHPLAVWVLDNSIKQCREWQLRGIEVGVAVNLSARNLMDENIPTLVEQLLSKHQLAPSLLELEITESSIMSDPARALRILQRLHELGVHLTIDDFGTGYSSLAYIKRLPVQSLKIDRSFVRNMLQDVHDDLIVSSTIHLAHNLGLSVVAEGVENEELLQRLRAMGCDQVQGYHIGRPMPQVQADYWLAQSPWAKPPAGDNH